MSSPRRDDARTPTTSGADALAPLRHRIIEVAPTISRDLPWSTSKDPWAIVVSEFMLQQTSVARVREIWSRFLERFPTPTLCALAPQSDVVLAWQGLGYPRRARNLHLSAKAIVDRHGGQVPESLDELLALPGVGPYTARAVASFAFGAPHGVLDTNSGRVLARCVAGRALRPREAQQLVDELVADDQSALFNQALLDLGAQFCRARPICESCPVNDLCVWRASDDADPARLSAAVSRAQVAFEGSDRQLRGRVMRQLHDGQRTTDAVVAATSPEDPARVARVINALIIEGLIEQRGENLALAD